MYRNEHVPPNPLLTAYLVCPEAQPLESRSKAADIFDSIKNSLSIATVRIKSALSNIERSHLRNSLFGEGNVLAKTENRGKLSDAATYAEFSRSPVKLNRSGLEILDSSNCGPTLAILNYPDPWKMELSPEIDGQGKCLGGTTTFISDYLCGENIRTTAEKFEGGVPLDGVISQEIYNKSTGYKTDLGQIDLEDGLNRLLRGSKDNPNQYNLNLYQNLSPDQRGLLEQVHRLVNEEGCTRSTPDFIDRIKTTPENQIALKRALNTPDLHDREQGIARLNGLEIDWSSGSKSAQEIVDAVKNLEPGAYQLSFPTTNVFGKETAQHTTALIMGENQVYFYDPNFAVAKTSDPTKTVGRVFKLYTGYETGVLGKIKNFFLSRPNPSNQTLSSGFTLSRYREFQPSWV